MAVPVQGLTGLIPAVTPTVVTDPGATAAEIHGGPANPEHGVYEWDDPVPWLSQQGLDVSGQAPTVAGAFIAQVPPNALAGADPDSYADPTATMSHAAPWPSQHIPDGGAVNNAVATAEQSQANQLLHSIDSGDVQAFTTNLQVPLGGKMPWELSPDYVSSGAPEGTDVGQLTDNAGTGRDRFAGTPDLNQDGMDSAHVRRYAASTAARFPVPDTSMMGAQRPMVMNVPGRYEYPTGPGSPFYGQIPGVGNDTGAAEIGVASDYVTPPQAPVNPPLAASTAEPVWGWDGY